MSLCKRHLRDPIIELDINCLSLTLTLTKLARPWYQKTIMIPLDLNPLEWKIANIVFFSSSKLLGHLRGKNLIPGRKWAKRERAKTAIVQKHKMCLFWVFIFERDLHWRSVERGNVFVYVAWKIRMLWKCRAFINQVVLTQGKLDSAALPSALSALSHFFGSDFQLCKLSWGNSEFCFYPALACLNIQATSNISKFLLGISSSRSPRRAWLLSSVGDYVPCQKFAPAKTYRLWPGKFVNYSLLLSLIITKAHLRLCNIIRVITKRILSICDTMWYIAYWVAISSPLLSPSWS